MNYIDISRIKFVNQYMSVVILNINGNRKKRKEDHNMHARFARWGNKPRQKRRLHGEGRRIKGSLSLSR